VNIWAIGAGLTLIALIAGYTVWINVRWTRQQDAWADSRPNPTQQEFVAMLMAAGADAEVSGLIYTDMRGLCRWSHMLPHPDDPFRPLYVDDPEDLIDYARDWKKALNIGASSGQPAAMPWITLRDAALDLSRRKALSETAG
jgi:hypothetical protein